MEINSKDYPGGFVVCGVQYRTNKRFRITHGQNFMHYAFAINLWRGNVWGILANGKRKLLKSVYN